MKTYTEESVMLANANAAIYFDADGDAEIEMASGCCYYLDIDTLHELYHRSLLLVEKTK